MWLGWASPTCRASRLSPPNITPCNPAHLPALCGASFRPRSSYGRSVGDTMPAPQLHLTFGETLGRERLLADELRAACAAEPRYTRLGSIFHDLAYYGNMAWMAIRYGLRRPAEESYWGAKVHYDRPDEFLSHFVATARAIDNELTRSE